MATAGKIFHNYTSVEIDESGRIWLILNHFESPSVIEEMQASSNGITLIDDFENIDYALEEEDDEVTLLLN